MDDTEIKEAVKQAYDIYRLSTLGQKTKVTLYKDPETIDRTKMVADIYSWKPHSKKEVLIESEDSRFLIHFSKLFPQFKDKVEKFEICAVKKSRFEQYLTQIANYLNYFVNNYDTEDRLMTAYLKIQYMLVEKKAFDASNVDAFIDLIYATIFTPEICVLIRQMVEDNYLDDIERNKGANNGKKYLESLEFTNHHNKILLRISMGMKMIFPIMYHYFTINTIKPDELKEKRGVTVVYDFYFPLFDLFSDGINMFNKLYVYIKRNVLGASFYNKKIYDQRYIFGDDKSLLIEKFIKTQLIVNNMVKYAFNKTWDPKVKKYKENIIGFQKTIVNFQLLCFRKETYGKTLTEMTNTQNSEGLSASDKMEMNMTKLDAGLLDMANINVDICLNKLTKDIDVPITEEEIAYYRKNHFPSDIQVHLVRSYYASFFSSYRDENLLTRYQYNRLLLLLKKKLLLESGYEMNDVNMNVYLPYILTGNLEGPVVKKKIRNAKLVTRLDEDPLYQYLVNEQYKELEERKPGFIKALIGQFLNTQFTYVCYEKPELTGQPIIPDEDTLCYEILLFLKKVDLSA